MEKKRLPVELLDEAEFAEFKKKSLDVIVLSDETLSKIERLFAVRETSTGTLCCDEMHGHTYSCVYFYNPTTGIVNRLVDEIREYKRKLDNIHNMSKQ